MLEDPSAGKTAAQRNALQRSNRVFILEYSPERSKSKKKQKQWDTLEPRKEKLSSFLSRREMLSENEPAEEFTHRRNIDRLAALASRTRNSREAEGESGCEKLVRTVDRILKSKNPLADALESLKKYSMLCSSSNYELFIQSKHHNLIRDRRNEPPQSPLDSIYERRSFDESNSHQNSQISPRKGPSYTELTFRKKIDEVVSPLQESILHGLESPRKCFEPFKLSRELIPTAETLQSCTLLPMTHPPVTLPRLCSNLSALGNLNEAPLGFIEKREEDFLHLCHLLEDSCPINLPEKEQLLEGLSELQSFQIPQAKTQTRPAASTSFFSRGKLDFALPTPIAPSPTHRGKISINYVSEGVQVESFRKNKRNMPVLTAKEIADRMLFGKEATAVPEKDAAAPQEKQVGEPKVKKRVSSLPKITFTYSSREKDMKLQSPSAKCIPLPASPKAVLKAASPRKSKEELHSTFGSTEMAVNSSNSRSSRLQSPQHVQPQQKMIRVVREPASFIPFSGRPMAFARMAPRIDSEYYGAAHNPIQQQHLRPRITTQALPNNEIQYVGIEQQPLGCCWAKETRSKSLNERVLVGVSSRPF